MSEQGLTPEDLETVKARFVSFVKERTTDSKEPRLLDGELLVGEATVTSAPLQIVPITHIKYEYERGLANDGPAEGGPQPSESASITCYLDRGEIAYSMNVGVDGASAGEGAWVGADPSNFIPEMTTDPTVMTNLLETVQQLEAQGAIVSSQEQAA